MAASRTWFSMDGCVRSAVAIICDKTILSCQKRESPLLCFILICSACSWWVRARCRQAPASDSIFSAVNGKIGIICYHAYTWQQHTTRIACNELPDLARVSLHVKHDSTPPPASPASLDSRREFTTSRDPWSPAGGAVSAGRCCGVSAELLPSIDANRRPMGPVTRRPLFSARRRILMVRREAIVLQTTVTALRRPTRECRQRQTRLRLARTTDRSVERARRLQGL